MSLEWAGIINSFQNKGGPTSLMVIGFICGDFYFRFCNKPEVKSGK
jgi:hypothetical protein